MLHGAGGGGWEWNLWRGVFEAEGHAVLSPDLMPAPAGLAATSLEDYRRQSSDLLQAFEAPAVVVGASLGGLLALMLAAGSDVRALVLVNPLPPLPESADLPPGDDVAGVVPWRSRGRYSSTCRAMPDVDGSTRLYAFRRWRDESAAVLAAARAGLELPTPACPLLLIASEQDSEITVATSAALAARLGASLVRVPGGHVAPLLGLRAVEAARIALAWLHRLR